LVFINRRAVAFIVKNDVPLSYAHSLFNTKLLAHFV
jgi:hypothetical protein